MYIPHAQLKNLKELVTPGKVIIIYGARRVGKTTLLEHFLKNITENYLLVNGDDLVVRQYLASQSISKLTEFIGNNQYLIIDEAQSIPQVGLNLKLIVDHLPNVKVIATGSSSFELAKDIGEPLTGRKFTLKLFPLAQMELAQVEHRHETKSLLDSRLIYGSYPEVAIANDNKQRENYLRELVGSYLLKDILAYDGVRFSNKLLHLLQLLAFQIGNEVSLNELGSQLGMSKNTIERYLDLLEKAFVIFKRGGFSRNLRKEIVKNNRYYFYDVGIRNALINNFNPPGLRNDLGQLWENYIIYERLKFQEYRREYVNSFFWRTYQRQEIDLVEEKNGEIHGYEIKLSPKTLKTPSEWKKAYPDASFELIHSDNYLNFITL
jgi:hypothetical protein